MQTGACGPRRVRGPQRAQTALALCAQSRNGHVARSCLATWPATAPLARAVCARVPSGTRSKECFVFLTPHYGRHAPSGVPPYRWRRSAPIHDRACCALAVGALHSPAKVRLCVLLACAARCEREARFGLPSRLSPPRCADPGLRPVGTLAPEWRRGRGACSPPSKPPVERGCVVERSRTAAGQGRPRLLAACIEHAPAHRAMRTLSARHHATLDRPLQRSLRSRAAGQHDASRSRAKKMGGFAREPPINPIRGHRLPRLCRGQNPTPTT
jgi:hypothetical protein